MGVWGKLEGNTGCIFRRVKEMSKKVRVKAGVRFNY
jgi:hypothetical protein